MHQMPVPILPDDLLAEAIEHMNTDHADAVLLYAQQIAGMPWATQAELTTIEVSGFRLTAHADQRMATAWVTFETPLTDPAQLRAAFVRLARKARQLANESEE